MTLPSSLNLTDILSLPLFLDSDERRGNPAAGNRLRPDGRRGLAEVPEEIQLLPRLPLRPHPQSLREPDHDLVLS